MSVKKPAVKKVSHDATASTRATIGQLCVGLLKCYEMKPGQKVSIEELGDVTIDSEQQVEVKFYKGALTDGHLNFWKTLKNWVNDTYNADSYASLVLHTTQSFAEGARLREWNDADADKRLRILKSIQADFAKRFSEKTDKDRNREPSLVYKLQEYVLDPTREDKLKLVIKKYVIEAECAELSDLAHEIMETKILGIPQTKKKNYLNSLLGYVFSPTNKSNDRWEITHQEFHAKLEELTDTFRKETRIFPKKAMLEAEDLEQDDLPTPKDALFIKKIQDIGYGEDVIYRAKRDHFGALNTINQVFAEHSISRDRVDGFVGNVLAKFEPLYRSASRRCINVIPESQDFYDERHADDPPNFDGYDGVDHQFRNGVLHIQMDIEFKNLKWSLK